MHLFGFEIVKLESISDINVEMSKKRLKIKDLGQRYKFENQCIQICIRALSMDEMACNHNKEEKRREPSVDL